MSTQQTITITKEQLTKAITSAFCHGEAWGVCYSTWFIPSYDDSMGKLKEAIEDANEILKEGN